MAHDRDAAHDDTAHLRAEIHDTRERMSETLDQLGTRLNPNRIKAQVRDNIREATVGKVENMARHATERVNETRAGILDTVRDNPIPAAMIGLGLGWLLFNGRRREHSHDQQANQTHGQGGFGYVGDVSGTTPRLQQDDAAGGLGASISHNHEAGVVDRVRGGVSNVGDRASQIVGEAQGKLSDVAGRAQERVQDVAHHVGHVASDVRQTTRYEAQRIEERFQRTMTDNPLAVGAVALVVGMAAGFAIPETRRESKVMGGARDQLVGRVRNAAEEAREKVQHVAERVIDETRETAKTAARDEGLTLG